jgi:hypothetical protein
MYRYTNHCNLTTCSAFRPSPGSNKIYIITIIKR